MSKWNTGLLSFLMAATFLVSACTPRDVQVLSDAERAQLDKKKSDRTSGASAKGPSKDDMILASHLVERQAEALQMLLWAQDAGSFNKGQDPSMQVLVSASKADQLTQYFKFASSKKEYLNYKSTLSGSIHAETSFVPNAATPTLARMEITSIGFATFLQVNGSKDTLQAIDARRELTVSPASDKDDEFNVVYSTDTRLTITKAGTTDERTLFPRIEMRVRFNTAEKTVEVVSSQGNIRSYDRFTEQNISSQDLKISFDECVKMVGTITVVGKGTADLKVDEASFSSAGWSSNHAACAQRPVVDWRRFLEN